MGTSRKPEEAILHCLRKSFIGKKISVCYHDGKTAEKTEVGKINDVCIDFSEKFRNFFFITDNISIKRVEAKDGICKIENIDTGKLRVLHAFKPEIID